MATRYRGIVLFDIDGTLTTNTRENNHEVVQYFLDRNYSVGICTAGPIYSPNTLLFYEWMPENLYLFMRRHDFNTFNNVSTKIVCGRYNPYLLKEMYSMNDIGWNKGIALENSAEIFDITNPSKMFLFDNEPEVLLGCHHYNKNMIVIPAGEPAIHENLSVKLLQKRSRLF
mgnify:CR=1 FL=1|jgi:hypothetical protein